MTTRDVEAAVQQIDSVGSSATFDQLRKYLQLTRELKLRDSENVAKYGLLYLRKFRSRLSGEEEALTSEQVAIAAIDCRAHDAAFLLVTGLRKRFPASSQRTTRLVEMYFESKEQLDKAQETYIAKGLEAAPDSQILLKRQVALEKTRDNISGAIDLLSKYLDIFMTDREAWEELGELYLQVQMYSQAAHCYEELILHQPHHIPFYVQYADVLYTIGGSNGHNYRTARAYYAAAVQLSGGNNVRALYGLAACAAQLGGIKGSIGKDPEELGSLAARLLQQAYSRHCPERLKLVQDMLKSQGLQQSAIQDSS